MAVGCKQEGKCVIIDAYIKGRKIKRWKKQGEEQMKIIEQLIILRLG